MTTNNPNTQAYLEKTDNTSEERKANSAENANNAKDKLRNKINSSASVPSVNEEVYENLPETLKSCCSLLNAVHERDIFLVSALPVLAAHMPNVLAEHKDGKYSPDLFTLIVASPGAGKSNVDKAKKLGSTLSHILTDGYVLEELAETEFKDIIETQNMTTGKSLFLPANTSSRAIYDTLRANNGRGLLFETEIDTMLNATSQEWGNFSDIVRKAFHHETISLSRKKEQFCIDRPYLSICLTGTFDQFRRMFKSAENGHFSRYAFYTFEATPTWRSQRPTNETRELDQLIEDSSHKLAEMYLILGDRKSPIHINLTEAQWDSFDALFSAKMEMIEMNELPKNLHASNKRCAIIALRIASIFTVLRAFESAPKLLGNCTRLTPKHGDIESALSLAEMFLHHAFKLHDMLPKTKKGGDSKGSRYRYFYESLPNNFSTSEALEIARSIGIPQERTVKGWLSKNKEFQRVKHGHYKKIDV